MVMWFLVWFMFTNNKLDHYILGQYNSFDVCKEERDKSLVLVTNSTTAVYCFEVIPK